MKSPLMQIFLAFSVLLLSCGGDKKTARPSRKDITQVVYASGKLFPLNDYKVYSKYPGYVKAIHVKVGDTIVAGQPLITIRNDQTAFSAESAKNLMELAYKNASADSPLLLALKNEMNSARARYELDSINHSRYSELMKQNAASQVQLDQAKVQFEVSRQAWQKSAHNFRSTKDRLSTEAANAELQYKSLLANRNEFVILADNNGKVYDIDARAGEMVALQKPVMEIGDAKGFEVELNVDETDISFIQPGQEVLFEIDAHGDEKFKGRIREIYPRISQSTKTSKVIADIEQVPGKKFYSSLSVEANIIISSRKNALVIPREFIVEGNKIRLKGKEELVAIKKGLEDLEFVEVTEGISESDELARP